MVLGCRRPVGLAGAGRFERRVRPHFWTLTWLQHLWNLVTAGKTLGSCERTPAQPSSARLSRRSEETLLHSHSRTARGEPPASGRAAGAVRRG